MDPFSGFIRVMKMAAKELQELRAKYRSAYSLYMQCVTELADASQRGQRPPDSVLAAENRAFSDLELARRELLKALVACGQPDQKST
jgi:hypothetical protein